MKKKANILILSVAALVIIVAGSIAYLTDQKQIKSATIAWTDQADSIKIQKIDLRTDEKNVFHLSLKITSESTGGGHLKIGVTDSTTFREYTVEPGNTTIEYNGDWYASACYILFTPAKSSKGELKVEADFVGD